MNLIKFPSNLKAYLGEYYLIYIKRDFSLSTPLLTSRRQEDPNHYSRAWKAREKNQQNMSEIFLCKKEKTRSIATNWSLRAAIESWIVDNTNSLPLFFSYKWCRRCFVQTFAQRRVFCLIHIGDEFCDCSVIVGQWPSAQYNTIAAPPYPFICAEL